jgi:chorismate mutase
VTIRQLRRRIDTLDRRLVKLLSERARYSLAIGWLKRTAGLPLFHRRREQEISRNVRCANPGPLSDSAINHLFAEILRLTRAAVRAELRRRASHRVRK